MVEIHGEKARIGMQSFRQLEPGEETIPGYCPTGWTKEATNWGESAIPLCNVGAAMNLPRAAACGVRPKIVPRESEYGLVDERSPEGTKGMQPRQPAMPQELKPSIGG